MNYLLLGAGIISLSAVAGHFAMGGKEYLKPIMNSNAGPIPRYVMKSLFHYLSVFQVLATLLLFLAAIDFNCRLFELNSVARLLGVMYVGFGISQIVVAANSSVKGGVFKMFQWIFWLLIGVLAILGS
ncbi:MULTISPECIES: hypothetical protein [unclassified Saccharicrinis]|uniref:hypothetical protein n=1 Tax=unclassified Saccharicrinis TaxID=2646859 RepID=UPI003D340897